MSSMGNYLFISYSSHDKTVADAICHFLEDNSIPCWIAPRDILPGDAWAGSIIKAIRNCSAMLLIYSKNSNDSGQVANEVDKAFSNGKTIIPFMMDQTPLNDDFDYYLSRKHWLVAYPDYKTRFADLLNAVAKVVPPYNNSDVIDSNDKGEQTDVSSLHSEEEKPVENIENIKPQFIEDTNHTSDAEVFCDSQREDITEAEGRAFSPKWSDDITEAERMVISEILNNMVRVQGGRLELGATKEQLKWAKKNEYPAHPVELSTYWICKYPVTCREWDVIMDEKDATDKDSRVPKSKVSLIDCRNFINKLRLKSGINFALPTEAQWEFAARGGIKSKGYLYSGSDNLNEVGWYFGSTSTGLHEVGLLKPNELGIFDMSGNIFEWCDEKYGKYSDKFTKDPHNLNTKESFWSSGNYVLRGGGNISFKKSCRVSGRCNWHDTYKGQDSGFRLVIKADDSKDHE